MKAGSARLDHWFYEAFEPGGRRTTSAPVLGNCAGFRNDDGVEHG